MAESLKVKQAIKRKFPTIDIDDSLETAMQRMAEHNVSVLAVKVGEELVGIATVWDVLNGLANDYDRKAHLDLDIHDQVRVQHRPFHEKFLHPAGRG